MSTSILFWAKAKLLRSSCHLLCLNLFCKCSYNPGSCFLSQGFSYNAVWHQHVWIFNTNWKLLFILADNFAVSIEVGLRMRRKNVWESTDHISLNSKFTRCLGDTLWTALQLRFINSLFFLSLKYTISPKIKIRYLLLFSVNIAYIQCRNVSMTVRTGRRSSHISFSL